MRCACLLVLATAAWAACSGCAAKGRADGDPDLGPDLATAANAFYADHGRWPRELDELPDFDSSRIRTARFTKRLAVGGLEIHYSPRSARPGDKQVSMYLPPPRSWSPKGARTQPATAPAPGPTTVAPEPRT